MPVESAIKVYRRTPPTTNSRDYVLYRRLVQRDPCSYCGAAGGTKDHITPKAAGGLNEPENLTGACRPCNFAKGADTLLGFLHAVRWGHADAAL